MVPPGAKDKTAKHLNVPSDNISEWEATDHGIQVASVQTNRGFNDYFVVRAQGMTSTSKFYSDMSDVKTDDVKRSLSNIRNQVKVLAVPRECEIRELAESEINTVYKKGSGFYQLTKPEKIQAYKKILIMEKNKQAVYGGDDARNILKLPNADVKVYPGNHANFDIFVQSTSVNRKLVRGTKLLVLL